MQPAQADLELQFLDAPTVAQASIPTLVGVRVRNLGPAVATGVKVAVTCRDGLTLGGFGYGPRASIDLLEWNTFQTQLLPGESATVGFYVTPTREGAATGFVRVQQSDQIDPNPANDTLSLTLNVGPAPPIPPILRVRKVRTDFFDQHTHRRSRNRSSRAESPRAVHHVLAGGFVESARLGIPQAMSVCFAARARHLHRSRRSRRDDAGVSLADVLSTPVASLMSDPWIFRPIAGIEVHEQLRLHFIEFRFHPSRRLRIRVRPRKLANDFATGNNSMHFYRTTSTGHGA